METSSLKTSGSPGPLPPFLIRISTPSSISRVRALRTCASDHPLLQTLPRWALPTPPPSRYRVRRAHRPEQRSTLEAACLALGALEGEPTRYAPLLAAFDGWVDSLAARRPAGPPTA